MSPLRPCGIIEHGQELGLVDAHICPEPVNATMYEFKTNEAMLAAKSQYCNITCPVFYQCQPQLIAGTRTQINGTGLRMRANSAENISRKEAQEIFLPYTTPNE